MPTPHKYVSTADLWDLIAWAEMHGELMPFGDTQQGIDRGIAFVQAEIDRRNRRAALRALGRLNNEWRPRANPA